MTLLLTLAAAFAGAALFQRLGVPAGALIGAMVAVAAVRLATGDVAALPGPVKFPLFALLGWLIGQDITRDLLSTLARLVGPIVLVVVVLLAVGGLLAWVLVRAGVDPATAFLATSPGALSQMAALSAATGANGSLVATVHLLRVVTIILLAPLILRLLPAP